MSTHKKHLKIALGTDDFKEMAKEYDIFVDKTLFIKEIIDSNDKSILITYPRRWGKTLNLNMLKTFLEPESEECNKKTLFKQEMATFNDISQKTNWKQYMHPKTLFTKIFSSQKNDFDEKDKSFSELQCNRDIFIGSNVTLDSGEQKTFNRLQIADVDSGEYMKYQGKYPVIFISLKDLVGNSLEEIQGKLKTIISDLYKEHKYLLDSAKLDQDEKGDFQKYIEQNYKNTFVENGIKFLMGLLHKHYGQRVYVLVDEYDKPVNSLLESALGQAHAPEQDNLIKDVTRLISQTLCSPVSKTNPHLEKLILTGIFDTTQKESGSGCNNLSVYGISDINFSKSFGFSEEEVVALVTQFSFAEHVDVLNKIKDWYDGYSVPVSINQTIHAYTPWAVMKYLDTAYTTQNFEPKNYWTQSGASTILQKLLTKESCVNTTLSQKLLDMAEHSSVDLQFNQQISLFKYDWFADIDNEKFFSYLLLNSGYFTVQKRLKKYEFSIPNAELLEEFTSIISNHKDKCKQILYNLQKTIHLKVIEMIKQNDVEGIEKLLAESHINCEDKSMNFNFYHLASIFGKKEVFQTLLKSKCSKYLDFSNDKIANLKPIDYAFMLRNDNVTEVIKDHYQKHPDTLMKIPGWSETLFCFAYINSIGGSTVSGVVDFAKDLILGPLNVGFKAFGYIFSSIAGDNVFKIYEQNCKQSSEYYSIDVSAPENFETLKQFEKYLLEHKEAYVVANSDCNVQQEKLMELTYPIFENSFYSDEEIKFTLCGKVSLSEEL
jgi:hypothetical protein